MKVRLKWRKNGVRSCGDKSRHINIRYFFIKDVLERERIDLEHYGTENMVADFLTKPLQGALFRRMMDIIMGHTCFTTEERVDSSRKMTKMSVGTVGTKIDVRTKKLPYAEFLKKRRK